MAKSQTTVELEDAIFIATAKIGTLNCFEVTMGRYGDERVDYMTYDSNGIWRCYEVKSSLQDFRSTSRITFAGHYNYYVLTQELYEQVKDEIPNGIGVYVYGKCVKQAKKRPLSFDEELLKWSFMRSLAREAQKLYKSQSATQINKLQRQLRQASVIA